MENKYTLGSDKTVKNKDSEAYNKLVKVAEKLEDTSVLGYNYVVERCYEDAGAGMEGDTIICYETPESDGFQVLNPRVGLDLVNSDGSDESLDKIVDEIKSGEYFRDKEVNEDFENDSIDDSDFDAELYDYDREYDKAEQASIDSDAEEWVKDYEAEENSERAGMMNQVISNLNNEEAYFGSGLNIWPDGADRESCRFYFSELEDLVDLEEMFEKVYKRNHADGLYTEDKKIIDFAHQMDKELGLPPIKIIHDKR